MLEMQFMDAIDSGPWFFRYQGNKNIFLKKF